MKRVLCVWFPNWPLQRIRHTQPELKQRPLVLYSDSPHGGLQVIACSQHAAAKGITPGMPLAEAKGILERSQEPGARSQNSSSPDSWLLAPGSFLVHDSQADLAALRRLAASCQCFSPCCGIEESESPESLLLDITGCEHLFGGEKSLTTQLAQYFHEQGYVTRIAVAHTVGAAWAIARYTPSPWWRGLGRGCDEATINRRKCWTTIVSAPQHQQALSSLPIEALRLPTHITQTLHELNIRHIAQLQALPRASLAARFGDEVAKRLDQTTGHLEELITPVHLPKPIEATWSFEEPVNNRTTLQAAIRHLLDQITKQLKTRQQGVRSLLVHLGTEKRHVCSFTVGLVQPRASARHLCELIEMQFERLTLPATVTRILLRATITTSLLQRQHSILHDQESQSSTRDLAALIERIGSRLGERSILQPWLYPDAQPEYAFRLSAIAGGSQESGAQNQEPGARSQESGVKRKKKKKEKQQPSSRGSRLSTLDSPDSWLLTPDFSSSRPLLFESIPIAIRVVSVIPNGPPGRFSWQGQDHRVTRYWGPERIETGWWRDRHVQRDYYRVETNSGEQLWLFRCTNTTKWFLQGLFE